MFSCRDEDGEDEEIRAPLVVLFGGELVGVYEVGLAVFKKLFNYTLPVVEDSSLS